MEQTIKTHSLANQKINVQTDQCGSVRTPFKPQCKFLRRISFATTDLALMALISHHLAVRLGTCNSQFQPQVPLQLCIHRFDGAVSHRTHTNMTRRGACCPSTPPCPRPAFLLPPHLVLRLRLHVRLRRQQLPRHRRTTLKRSAMQRRPSVLRRAAAVRQTPPLSAHVRAPPPAPAPPSVPHLHSTEREREKKRERERERARERKKEKERARASTACPPSPLCDTSHGGLV